MTKFPPDAYFAGLIDGEASLYLMRRSDRANPIPVIEVNMVCERTIRMLCDRFGGAFGKKRPSPPGKQMQYRWRVQSAKARAVVAVIAPYVVTRRERVEELIAHWEKGGLWEAGHLP